MPELVFNQNLAHHGCPVTLPSFCEHFRFRKMANQKETPRCQGFMQSPIVYFFVSADLAPSPDFPETITAE